MVRGSVMIWFSVFCISDQSESSWFSEFSVSICIEDLIDILHYLLSHIFLVSQALKINFPLIFLLGQQVFGLLYFI